MNPPAQPQPAAKTPADKPRQRQQPRRQHQPYRRTSAVIDERPDGKPIIFGYGRHLTKKEKERVQKRIAYGVLGLIVVVSIAIIAGTAIYNTFIYPNQSVASVNGHGISRHDRDAYAGYATAASAKQGQTLPQDASSFATQQLQKQLLTQIEADQTLKIKVTDQDVTTELNKEIKASGQGAFDQFLSQMGLSKDDYTRLILAPQLLRTKIGVHLTQGNPKVAEQWDYARILVLKQQDAQDILKQLIPTGTGPISKTVTFASLAKAKSTDLQTKPQGGDLGWQRVTDGSQQGGDPLLQTTFLPTLKSMDKTHTKYKIVQSGKQWYVIELIGHDLKHPLSQNQIQVDQTNAFNTWYGPLNAKAIFVPPVPASQLNGGTIVQQPTSSGK